MKAYNEIYLNSKESIKVNESINVSGAAFDCTFRVDEIYKTSSADSIRVTAKNSNGNCIALDYRLENVYKGVEYFE